MLDKKAGIVEVRRLATRDRDSSLGNWANEGGIWPEKLLAERSR